MTRWLRAVLLVATASCPAAAEPQPMTSALRCAEVQALVARRGAVVMRFSPTTYDRVVADRRFCLLSETIETLWAPTRDAPQCFAGYTCREADSWPSF